MRLQRRKGKKIRYLEVTEVYLQLVHSGDNLHKNAAIKKVNGNNSMVLDSFIMISLRGQEMAV